MLSLDLQVNPVSRHLLPSCRGERHTDGETILLIARRISQTQTAISSYAPSLLSGGFGTGPRYAHRLRLREVQEEASKWDGSADVHPQLNPPSGDNKGIWFQGVGKAKENWAEALFFFVTKVTELYSIFLVQCFTVMYWFSTLYWKAAWL